MKNVRENVGRQNLKFLLLPFYFLLFTCLSFAQTLAPNAPGKDAQWASAGKQGVGTSASLESKVWFTLQGGALTEVYYPDVTVANVHLLQFVVVNPKTKKVETERDDANHQIKVLRPDSLTFQQINTAKSGAWKITKTYTTDVERDSILIDVKFETKNKNLNLYVYYDPSLGNSGMNDRAYSPLLQLKGTVEKETTTIDTNGIRTKTESGSATVSGGMGAEDGKYVSALFFSTDIEEYTNGYYGVNDGLEQLRKYGKINETYAEASKGNVVQMAKLYKPQHFTAILSFDEDILKASVKASKSFEKGFAKCLEEYEKGWAEYVKTIPKVEPKYQAQFNMAAMQLKAHEDKSVRGANIASLSVPWGGGDNANVNNVGGYHLIWSRDLYQVATAFMAIGDTAAAERALDFLFKVQQKADGSFPQNSYLDGKPFWGSLQLDEVAFPLILAYQLGKNDKATYENHIKKAANFIVKNGPSTPQERWEEEAGFSPSTIAAEIAGLVCAADIAQKNGDNESANLWLKTADEWQANIEKWTVTTTGKYSKEPYYLRITQNGKPDAGEKIELNNGAGFFDEREIVDAGFLELVRLGIKSPNDKIIQNSLKVIDQVIRVKTPNGDGFYRYNNDGYGEMDDGRRWNWDGKYTGKGRLWTLLSGERGQYELAVASSNCVPTDLRTSDSGDAYKIISCTEYSNKSKSRLDAMLGFANEGLMIPEQVWDSPKVPQADSQFSPNLKFGEGTGSATPLAWSMAQFIRLAVNLQKGKNLDTPDVVYNRYVLGKKDAVSDNDILEVPASFTNGIDKRCFDEKPLYKKDCSYTSTLADENSQNPIIKKCRLGGFYFGCKESSKEMHACFNYKGQFKTLEIAGDFTDWKSVVLKIEKRQDGNLINCFNFAKTSRVEYKLIVDGKWINDPLNPNKIDNGVGGENSVFTMPDYQATIWDKEIEKSPLMSEINELEVESKKFGKRKVKIYLPSEYFKRGVAPKLPVLYLQDGSDYISRAKAINVLENLTAAKKIEPFMIVFIDPINRMKEYLANDDFADYVALEIVPAVEKKYFSTIKTGRENRMLLGASLGGITSVHIGLKHSDKFAKIGGQSISWWVDNERVVKELEKLDAAKTSFKFYIDDGTLEGVEDSRKAVEILKKKGFSVVYKESEAGHNWTAWRDRLADAFITLMQ